jgi:hypothetical protein
MMEGNSAEILRRKSGLLAGEAWGVLESIVLVFARSHLVRSQFVSGDFGYWIVGVVVGMGSVGDCGFLVCRVLLNAAVAAFAFLEIDQGVEQAGTIEIGPESFGDEDFRVGDLPEEEIADAHFAAGADEEIGLGEAVGVEMAGEFVLGYACEIFDVASLWGGACDFNFAGFSNANFLPVNGIHATDFGLRCLPSNSLLTRFAITVAVAVAFRVGVGMARGEEGVDGVDDFGAASVVQGDAEAHAGVGGGAFGGFADVVLDTGGEFVEAAEEAHADIIFLEEGHFFAEIFAEKLHQEIGFGFGAAPVFYGEGVEGEGFDFEAGAGFDGGAGAFGARAVTGEARQEAALGPAAVAVHDDSDVAWETRDIEFFEEIALFDAQWTEVLRGDRKRER